LSPPPPTRSTINSLPSISAPLIRDSRRVDLQQSPQHLTQQHHLQQQVSSTTSSAVAIPAPSDLGMADDDEQL
jgi:hypothetical protein